MRIPGLEHCRIHAQSARHPLCALLSVEWVELCLACRAALVRRLAARGDERIVLRRHEHVQLAPSDLGIRGMGRTVRVIRRVLGVESCLFDVCAMVSVLEVGGGWWRAHL